jgi:hypothetical protein
MPEDQTSDRVDLHHSLTEMKRAVVARVLKRMRLTLKAESRARIRLDESYDALTPRTIPIGDIQRPRSPVRFIWLLLYSWFGVELARSRLLKPRPKWIVWIIGK